MLEILVEGDKKKVACGPCIRGHRSSKCNHKDRLLIEVRKPGRPLSACPHPVGSCRCERLVLNYTIPKSSECPCPSSNTAVAEGRIMKQKARRPNAVNPVALQKALEVAPEILTHPAPLKLESSTSISSEGSSSGQSMASSSSSTPMVAAIDSGKHTEAYIPNTQLREDDNDPTQLSLGGIGPPFEQADSHEDWMHASKQHMPPPPVPRRSLASGSCCQPAPPVEEQSSCCQPPPPPPQKAAIVQSSCCSSTTQTAVNRRPSFAQEQMIASTFPPVAAGTEAFDITPLDIYPVDNGQSLASHTGHIYATPMPVMNTMTSANMQQHNCHCGDGCQCLGCAVHPRNPTTMGYVLYHGGMMMMNQQQHQHGRLISHFPVPAQQALSFAPNGMMQQQALPFPGFQYEEMYGNHTQAPMHDPRYAMMMQQQQQQQQQMLWSQQQMAPGVHTPTTELEQLHFHTPRMATQTPPHPRLVRLPTTPLGAGLQLHEQPNTETQLPHNSGDAMTSAPVVRPPRRQSNATDAIPGGLVYSREPPFQLSFDTDSPSQIDDDTTSTLSPSSYYVQSIAVDCDDDVCNCGPDCECVDCTIHGRNGAMRLTGLNNLGPVLDGSDEHTLNLLHGEQGVGLDLDLLPNFALMPTTTVP